MNETFLPFITDDQGRSLDVDNGVVVTRSIPDPIENSPEGWEQNTIQFTRNTEFRSVITAYTTSLKFYLDGAKILRNAFYRMGMETVLYFIWLKLDRAFGAGMQYKSWYKGEPDFGTFRDEWDGCSVNISEGGFFKDLQAHKTVVQDIPFDDDAVGVYIDGVKLRQKLNYTDVEDLQVSFASYGTNFFGPYILVSQDGASSGFLINSEQLESAPSAFADRLVSDNTILTNIGTVVVTVTITGTIEFKCIGMTSSPPYAVRFRYLRSGQTIVNQNLYQIISTVGMTVGTTYKADFSIDIPLEPGERLYREGIFFGGVGSDAIIEFTQNSKSSINFITRQVPAVILAHRVVTLGSKLAGKISQGATMSSPNFMDNDYNLMVTSGDAIRSIPAAVIKTSFSDWHKSIDAVKCVALDIVNNKPQLHSRYTKYDRTSTIAALGECSNWSLEPADEYIYDVVQIGYPSKAADSNIDVNGKYSFNNTYTWRINTTRRKATTYDAVSKYYADPYDITLIRVNLEDKTTTTGSTDNSNFFLDCEVKSDVTRTGLINFYGTDNKIVFTSTAGLIKYFVVGMKYVVTGSAFNNKVFTITDVLVSGLDVALTVRELVISEDIVATLTVVNLYQLRRPTVDSATGIPNDGTEFNLLITPRRNMDNHLRWLRSSFDHLDTNKLVLQTTDKNRDLVTTIAGITVNEAADIPVSTMGDKVFLPYYTTKDIQSPQDLLTLVTNNNYGVMSYTREGVQMDGFIIDVRSQDAYLETQQYRLLISANNDLTQLINNR
ncbi:MAG: hypothetical protein V4560_14795 [Bacteroidota bacterium]